MDSSQDGTLAVLYCSDGHDEVVSPHDLKPRQNADGLLWIDTASEEHAGHALQCMDTPGEVVRKFLEPHGQLLGAEGDFAWCEVKVASLESDRDGPEPVRLRIFKGPGFALTLRDSRIQFLEDLREREHGQTSLGRLSPTGFMVSLLDWSLETYFEAVTAFEGSVEEWERAVLGNETEDPGDQLFKMRTDAARLRAMLAPQRRVYAGVARPDFLTVEQEDTESALRDLDEHFDRAMNAVEGTRDLVVDALGLLSNQLAVKTHRTMRLLTAVTVVTGFLGVVAGVLGMNFQAHIFDAGNSGFLITVGAFITLGVVGILIGRHLKWY